jgi:hypothetical protein
VIVIVVVVLTTAVCVEAGIIVRQRPVLEPLSVSKRVEPTNLAVGDRASVTILVQSYLDKEVTINVTDQIPVDFVILSPFSQFAGVRSEGANTIVLTWFASLSPGGFWERSYDISPVSPSAGLTLQPAVVDWNGTKFYSSETISMTIQPQTFQGWFNVAVGRFLEDFTISLCVTGASGVAAFIGGRSWERRRRRRPSAILPIT